MYTTIGFSIGVVIVSLYLIFNLLLLSSLIGLSVLKSTNINQYFKYKKKIESLIKFDFGLDDTFEAYLIFTFLSVLVCAIGLFFITFLWLPIIVGICFVFTVLTLIK
jgi:ABC-type antimicrobial peptide transport system permease subunit